MHSISSFSPASLAGTAALLVLLALAGCCMKGASGEDGGGQGASTPATVRVFPAAEVAAAFGKGMPLTETDRYKIHAGRRVEPGIPELHERDTDIFYITEGTATFVTGGEIIEPKTTGPGEIRGKEIRGGEPRKLEKGDVIIIPAGVPHWFQEVPGLITYYVVKVTACD